MIYQKELEFAQKLAMEAGVIMLQHFHVDSKATTLKDDNTELTIADTSINDLVINHVRLTFTEDGVLGEESSYKPTRKRLWVCDPIDGTYPYAHGIPVSSFNLALVVDGQPVVSVIYDPFVNRLFSAVKGRGADLNGVPIKTSDKVLGRPGLSVEVWGGSTSSIFAEPTIGLQVRKVLMEQKYMQLYLCSVAYTAALVAKGDLAGVIFSGTNPWDAAAASLLVTEAGGVFTSAFGKQQKYNQPVEGYIAAPPGEHQKLLALLAPVFKDQKRR